MLIQGWCNNPAMLPVPKTAPSLTDSPVIKSVTRIQYKRSGNSQRHSVPGASLLVPKATQICMAPRRPAPDSANGWEARFLQNHLEVWWAPQEMIPWSTESKEVGEVAT